MAKKQWKTAVEKTRHLKDPWECFGFEDLPEISVKRHVYNSISKQWWKDDIVIKMEEKVPQLFKDKCVCCTYIINLNPVIITVVYLNSFILSLMLFLQPFARGAMRQCYRMLVKLLLTTLQFRSYLKQTPPMHHPQPPPMHTSCKMHERGRCAQGT